MASSTGLLSNGGGSLYLTNPTKTEIDEQVSTNSQEWKGALSVEAYIRREAYLLNTDLTRDGGLTPWVLVQGQGDTRQVLASCETYRKRAMVASNGQVDDAVVHGIASVFCLPQHRGNGYASKMISLLGERLRTWQVPGSHKQCPFSILYSDIGKKFYASHGWRLFPSAHVSIAPWPGSGSTRSALPTARPLRMDDLPELCQADEALLRQRLTKSTSTGSTLVAVAPDLPAISWHKAREAFVSNELYGKTPEINGAIVQLGDGTRVWCYWSCVWQNPDPSEPKGNVMSILRLVVEDPEYDDSRAATEQGVEQAKSSQIAAAIASLLVAAQSQASQWNMAEVEIWNPTSVTLAAARMLNPDAEAVHRDMDSLASLRWYGHGSHESAEGVEWVSNEKYAWC